MPEPKAQLIDPQGPIDVPGMQVTGVTTATGGFVGAVQGAATGLASTTANLSVGIVTATKFQGNTTGNVSGLADDTNINVGIITSTSFTGDLVGNAAGLSTTTANINAGIMSATSFAGNFTGVASGITGTPNIVVGIMTGTLNGDGSSLTGIAATNWIANNVTANSSTTTVDLSDGNVVKFTQSADTTVSFANTGTSNIVSFIRIKDSNATTRTLTWPSSIKWNNGSAPDLVEINPSGEEFDLITLLTRDEGVTWYGWLTASNDRFDNNLFLWGKNDKGQLAQNNATPAQYSSPTQVPGTNWRTFTAGQQHAITTKTDGTLWSWGYNNAGQLGQNNIVNYSSPVQIPGTTWSTVHAGYAAILITKTDGTLWAIGDGTYGRLGTITNQSYSSPVQIGSGTDWCTSGYNKVAVGPQTMYAIKTDGTLWASGRNNNGLLGQNTNHNTYTSSPVQIPGTTWDKVQCTGYQAYAIKTNGELWSWGYNGNGQLGQGNTTQRSSPAQVPGTSWKNVSGSYFAASATRTDGTLWTFGANDSGELGQNNNTSYSSPKQVPGTTWDTTFGSLRRSMLVTKTDGTLWSWGYNAQGALGHSQSYAQLPRTSSPTQIPGTTWIVDAGGADGGIGHDWGGAIKQQ